MDDKNQQPVAATPDPITAKAITEAFEKSPDEVTKVGEGPTTIPLEDLMKDPRMASQIRKWQRQMRANAPKHENFKECHRRCPLFKRCRCFTKSSTAQMECWKINMDQLYVHMPEGCELTKQGYNPHCLACEKWKTCAKLVADVMAEKLNKKEVKDDKGKEEPTA